MELSSTLGGASSSSAPSKHDVFLSFRGEDTRLGFTHNLYVDLVRKDLNVYMDDVKLPIGKNIRPELIQAIQESKSAIVILSENYADSTWCLDELAEIVECVETRKLILFPVFYKVDPSDVRNQRNKFDLAKYNTDDKVVSWRSALHKVGNLAGIHVKGTHRYETLDRDEIVDKISQQLQSTLPIGVPFPTTDVVLGEAFRKNCEEVLKYLKNDEVSSIGIYGMGGVGKTTVMMHVHNQILADPATFGHVCWVTVSQDFSIQQLQNDIFRKLNLPSKDDEMSRAPFLNDYLEKGKYILILDDVWVHIPLKKVGIPVGVSLCKVIVTTRSLDVCNKMVCQQKIKISPLIPKEAWELFMEKLGPHEELASEVKQIAKDVAKRCGGLPLAIITMAVSKRGDNDIHEWRNALDELKKPETFTINGIKSEVLPVLEKSYNQLGDEESKLCFLSCALFPEDDNIPRYELIGYCIVKGLIKKGVNRGAKIDMGYTILNKLVKCCLLESSYIECVMMHYLIRGMALEIMSRKQQVMVKAGFQLMKIPEEEEWTEDLEVVSLIHNDIREIPDGWSPRCPKLSTLMLQQNFSLTQIPDSFFVELCGLRVLNLSGLIDLLVLPASVGELTNLIALWLCGCSRLTRIPSLRNLKDLRDLDLSNTEVNEIPDGIGELRSLRRLNMINTIYQCAVEELRELQHLEEFRGWVQDASDYNVLITFKWFQQLWAYRLFVYGLRENRPFHHRGVENEVFLYELRLGGRGVVDVPHAIKRLVINQCHDTGKCLLEFCMHGENARTRELKEIEIKGCKEVEWVVAMPSSSRNVQLPGIEELRIKKMENMKGIFNWWEYCDSTPSIPNRGGGGGGDYNQSSFSKLKSLSIYKCDKMKVGLTVNCLVHIPVLEIIDISNCSGMEEIIGGGAGEDCENSNGISTDIRLPTLKWLYLSNLPSLRSVYNKYNIKCDSIEGIHLFGCGKLKRLPLTTTTSCSGGSPQCPFPSLKKIYIRRSEVKWWESLELVDPTYHELLQPFVSIQ